MLAMTGAGSGIGQASTRFLRSFSSVSVFSTFRPTGERLVYYAGPVETSLSTIDVDRMYAKAVDGTQVLSSTTLLRGRISPAGTRFFSRARLRGVAPTRRICSLMPRTGGAESQIPGAVEDLVILRGLPMAPGACICTNRIRKNPPDGTRHGRVQHA